MEGQGGCQGTRRPGPGHHTAGRKEGRAKGLSTPHGPAYCSPVGRVQMVPVAGARLGTYRHSVNERAFLLFQDFGKRVLQRWGHR